MTGDRWVVLGLAPARTPWFSTVAQWANAGTLPVEYVKCLSTDELRVRQRPDQGREGDEGSDDQDDERRRRCTTAYDDQRRRANADDAEQRALSRPCCHQGRHRPSIGFLRSEASRRGLPIRGRA